MLEYTENVAYNTSISLTFDNETQVKTKTLQLQMLAASRCALAILLAVTTEVTQISLMVWVALGKHQIAQQLVEHPCSMRFEKQTSVAENSFDCCWCARCTKTLSKSGFKHANCFSSLTRCQGIPASVPSSISSMNARYEATTVGREMWMT